VVHYVVILYSIHPITVSSSDPEESAESIKRFQWVRSINAIFYKPPPTDLDSVQDVKINVDFGDEWYRRYQSSGYDTESDNISENKMEDEEEDDVSDQGCLPWWFIYIAWFLTFGSCVTCAYFIMQYGLRYGWQTSLDWLVSMSVSVIQSVVIVQPIKVVVMAGVFAIFLKRHELDNVGAQFFKNWKLPKSKYLLII